MAKYVHVIPPEGWKGERHQEEFPDNTRTYEIYVLLALRAKRYGALKKGDEVMGYLDHPGTVVTFGKIEKGEFKPTEEIDKADVLKALAEEVQEVTQ